MADLSKFSTEDLEALSRGDLKAVSTEGLQHLHDSAVTPQSQQPYVLNLKETDARWRETLSPQNMNQMAANFVLPQVGGLAAQGLNRAGRVALSSLLGAGSGAAAPVEGEKGTPELIPSPERVQNMKLGGALGLGTGAVAEGASQLLGLVGGKAANRAGEKAAKAMGVDKPAAKVMINKYGPDSVRKLGQKALHEKLIPVFGTAEKIGDRASSVKKEVGEELGALIDSADAAGAPKVSAAMEALKLSDDPEIVKLKKIPGMEGIAERVDRVLNTLYSNGDELSLRGAQELRRDIDQTINFAKKSEELKGVQPYLYKIRDALNDAMNDSVNQIQGENSNALRAINRRYSDLARIEEVANKRLAGDLANRAIGLTDTIAGAGGASVGATMGSATGIPGAAFIGGLAGAGGNKLARTYGPALDARTSNLIANLLGAGNSGLSGVLGSPGASTLAVEALLDKARKNQDNAIQRRLGSKPGASQ